MPIFPINPKQPHSAMYIGFQHLHSTLAYAALILLLFSTINALYGWITSSNFTKKDKIAGLVTMIAAHLQLVIGLVLYFLSPLGFKNLSGETMADSTSRLYAVEHPLTMIIGIVLITIGYATAKRAHDDRTKHKRIALYYAIGLLLILSRIPWNAWPV